MSFMHEELLVLKEEGSLSYIMCWTADVDSDYLVSFCLAEANGRFATCLIHDRARDG